MCSPTVALFGASMALQAYSGYKQSQYQEEEGEAQGKYFDYLAETSKLQGEAIVKRADKQSELIQDVAKSKGKTLAKTQAQLRASQKTALAASGVQGVTAEDIATTTADEQYLDELDLRYNADIQSWGVTTDASYKNWASKTQATQYEYAGSNARYAGKVNARNTLLGTATSMLGSTVLFAAGGGFKDLFKPAPKVRLPTGAPNLSGGGW